MEKKYWLQTKTLTGNWVDHLSANKDACIAHGEYLIRNYGVDVQVVERVDIPIWFDSMKV